MQEQERERYILYGVVLFLALAVAWLGWRVEGGAKTPLTSSANVLVEAVAGSVERQLDRFEDRVADAMTGSRPDMVDVSPEAISDAVVEAIDGRLASIDRRVADVVHDTLQGQPSSPVGVATPVPVGRNFTFLFDNAYLDPEGEVTRDNKGIKLDGHHVKRLDLIVKAFLACQTIDDPVSFHVAGYSSTAEFRVETESGSQRLADTDKLNLATANLRMANVADYLESKGFEVDVEDWDSIEALRRPYIDDFEPGVDQQALNRAVVVQITNAGRCHLGQLAPPQR